MSKFADFMRSSGPEKEKVMLEVAKAAAEEQKKIYPTYYDTIVSSPAWQAWEKVAYERGFDWHESVECGWLSQKHFAAFLKWYKHECSDLKSE